MSALRARLDASRHLLVVLCLALIAGCIPQPQPLPAQAPTNLLAIPGNASVALTWSASIGATGYNVRRATTSGGPYTLLASPAAPAYTDSDVSNGTTYFYVVSALATAGESGASTQVSATPAIATLPAPPTNLTPTGGDTQVGLSWSASTGATSYRIKRATTDGGPYTSITTVTGTSYTDTGLVNGSEYFYVVTAINSAGESGNSAQVSGTPAPGPPTNFGTWVNVTPAGVDLASDLLGPSGCQNGGARSMQPDAAHAGVVYTQFTCQGIWKSTDYGATWAGPINTGTNGIAAGDCEGGITIAPTSTAAVPTIFEACYRGATPGFWKSTDGGVNWTHYTVGDSSARQDYFPPVVDPYDPNHLLMTGHEFDSIVESIDGGATWTAVPMNNGMHQAGLTGFIFFINTGGAPGTRTTWLWMGEQSGGATGTWRTANSGTTWLRVESQEHLQGTAQIYQPDTSGTLFIAGVYSPLGWGVLRSSDYGQTWVHEGNAGTANLVFGTSKNVYGLGLGVWEVASQPGTGTWVTPTVPAAITQDPQRVGVLNNGTSNIFVAAVARNGVWRYVEP